MSQVFVPQNSDQLWDFLDQESRARIFAGGTDLLVRFRRTNENLPALICLDRVQELKGVRESGPDILIGACSTHSALLADPLLNRHFPILAQALRHLGSPLIRNSATIGGNICTASPAGDTLPPLYALDAELEIRTRNASRRMLLKDFIRGPGATDLQPGEILAHVRLKKDVDFNVQHFEKVGQRNALAIAMVSLAALLQVSPAGLIEKARLAWGSVGPTVVTSPEAEAALISRPLCQETLEHAMPLVRKAVAPIDDLRATADYRRIVAGNLLLRLAVYHTLTVG